MNEENRPLPELQETILEADDLKRFFLELSDRSERLVMNVKGSARMRFTEISSIKELQTLLLEGEVWGAQLNYHVDGGHWLDTILVKDAGLRLVRIQQS